MVFNLKEMRSMIVFELFRVLVIVENSQKLFAMQ